MLLLSCEAVAHREAAAQAAALHRGLPPGPDAANSRAIRRTLLDYLVNVGRREELAARWCSTAARRQATARTRCAAEACARRTAGQPAILELDGVRIVLAGGLLPAVGGDQPFGGAGPAVERVALEHDDEDWEAEVESARRAADDLVRGLRAGRGEG
ncbi:MAG: hypothetical protein JXB32_14495 [Deltaproteobacteria bacterium]|nr:hypothetical protein [Deltaproteobacteria bacterium]